MLNLKNILITAALCLAIGFGAGYYTKGKFAKADMVDAVSAARIETADNIVKSVEADKAIVADVKKTDSNIAAVKQAIHEHTNKEATQNDTKNQSCMDMYVDAYVVGMLNHARAGTAPSATSASDAKVGATPQTESRNQMVGVNR